MKKAQKDKMKKSMAGVVAILLVVIMILSAITPLLYMFQ